MIATNMHLLGGYHEIKRMAWDDERLVLSGEYERAAGLEGKVYFHVPDNFRPLPHAHGAKGSSRWVPIGKNLWRQEVQFQGSRLEWAMPFGRAVPSG